MSRATHPELARRPPTGRVGVDGKFFAVGGRRFDFRGVTYGTFAPRDDGARFPSRDQVKVDFEAMAEHGFTVVRTYTVPPSDVIDLAADAGLRILCDVFYPDWRYLSLARRTDRRRLARDAEVAVLDALSRVDGRDEILAVSLGNEIPADAIRWFGMERIAGLLSHLRSIVRDDDPDRLVTYANYPTSEYLPLGDLDFLTFNVYLENRSDLRKYLTKLQLIAADRPLVLGEIGLHTEASPSGERHQAEVIGWQLETAMERGVAGTCVFSWTDEWHVGDAAVEGWRFGLTTADRRPRLALDTAASWNGRTVADLDYPWPSISVVVCAYNAAATLDECLVHLCQLEYPDLEIIVVDDGSTDETLQIAQRFPRARVVEIDHAGLSVARNEGFRAATGRVVAYLDSDAYPTPDWLYFLALAFDSHRVGGVGGPNVPPIDSDFGERVVSQAPGGPVHVLITDDRAEHVPGCNMAFYREVIAEIGGFDPVFVSAGDDVDVCWKVLDRGWEIGFHPAALVWHRRRTSLGPYLRQQLGYGRSEALVAARHPDRFTSTGTARWRGRIYDSLIPSARGQSIYRGTYGSAAFQGVYRSGGHALDLAHQIGIPAATIVAATAPLGIIDLRWVVPAAVGVIYLLVLGTTDAMQTWVPRELDSTQRLRFRASVAMHHLLQPLVRWWGRTRHRRPARAKMRAARPLPVAVGRSGSTVLLPADRPRTELVDDVVATIRQVGLRPFPSTGWEDYDICVPLSGTVVGRMVTTSTPANWMQVRLTPHPRPSGLFVLGLMLLLALVAGVVPTAIVALIGLAETVRGIARSRMMVRRLFQSEPDGQMLANGGESS